jgi:lycopene cyclase domain-containing protein
MSLVILIFNDRLYTTITFSLFIFSLFYLQFIGKVKWLSRFYVGYLFSFLPFLIVNGVLTSLPVVIYNNTENLGFRIGTIPVEDTFYGMLLILLNTAIYEKLKAKSS